MESTVKADRLITDANDTLVLTKYGDDSLAVDIIKDDNAAIQIVLTKRDIEQMSEIIHRHDEA